MERKNKGGEKKKRKIKRGGETKEKEGKKRE